ncbi:hypothetical protein ACQKWADRAFT_307166 [Trichoderma austrokoningii]
MQSVCIAQEKRQPIFRAQRLISSGVKAAGLPASGVNGRQWSSEAGQEPSRPLIDAEI